MPDFFFNWTHLSKPLCFEYLSHTLINCCREVKYKQPSIELTEKITQSLYWSSLLIKWNAVSKWGWEYKCYWCFLSKYPTPKLSWIMIVAFEVPVEPKLWSFVIVLLLLIFDKSLFPSSSFWLLCKASESLMSEISLWFYAPWSGSQRIILLTWVTGCGLFCRFALASSTSWRFVIYCSLFSLFTFLALVRLLKRPRYSSRAFLHLLYKFLKSE